MMAKKTIVVPCIVNSWLYISALTRFMLGLANCARMIAASTPPQMKKQIAV
jgi:hypothetical protein